MHVILATVGSSGDVLPFAALGRALCARGHRVTLAANEQHQAAAEDCGLAFRALLTRDEAHEFLSHPDIWRPLKCALVGARLAVAFLRRQYELLAALAGEGDAVLVANPGILAARLVQEKLGEPLATALICPWFIASSIVPPKFRGGIGLPGFMPPALGKLYWRLAYAAGDVLLARESIGFGPGSGCRASGKSFIGGCRRSALSAYFPIGTPRRRPTGRHKFD